MAESEISSIRRFREYLSDFTFIEESQTPSLFPERETKTIKSELAFNGISVPVFENEFWTSKQRQASSIHEISYRACFKPQLPRFFISRLTSVGDYIYDPFGGRGTTAIESALLDRIAINNDINPLSRILTEPRISNIPSLEAIQDRLNQIPNDSPAILDLDLSMFYHADTLRRLVSIRKYLSEKKENRDEDTVDKWIRMVATNRLTGHSAGFFSVYTLPPNQATSPESQKKINEKRNQKPEFRNVDEIILRKTKSLLRNVTANDLKMLENARKKVKYLNEDARKTQIIPSESVKLTVTSPPFLDIVQYSQDNWLRCWFSGIDVDDVSGKITVLRKLHDWVRFIQEVFHELFRITKLSGLVAFEVGEIRKKMIKLEEYVIPVGIKTGFDPIAIIINTQEFTKTSNIWGVDNNEKGTNSNRIAIFAKK